MSDSKCALNMTTADWQGAVLEHTKNFFACFDLNYIILYSNPAMTAATGWSIGDNARGDFLSPKSHKYIFEEATPAVLRGESWSGKAKLKRKDGSFVPCDTDLFPIFGNDGSVIGIAVSMLDISSHMELERANARLQLAREISKTGVWEISFIDEPLLTFDEGFQALTKLPYMSPMYLTNWTDYIKNIVDIENQPDFPGPLNEYSDNNFPLNLSEVRYNFPDGTFRYITTSSQTLCDITGKPERIVGMLIDVTEEVLARQEADKLQERRLHTQEIIARFSLPFTQPYKDFDSLINNALQDLQEFLNTDRIVLMEIQENDQLVCSYECLKNQDIPPLIGEKYDFNLIRPLIDIIDQQSYFYRQETSELFEQFPYLNRGSKSICYVPIMSDGKRWGYLLFSTIYETAHWTEKDFHFITMAGTIIMGAYSSLIREQNERELRAQAFMQDFSAPFLMPYNFDELIDNALADLVTYFKSDRANIYVRQGEYFICKFSRTRNPNTHSLFGEVCHIDEVCHILKIIDKQPYYFVPDMDSASVVEGPSFKKGARSVCYFPIGINGEITSILSIAMLTGYANWTDEFFRLGSMAATVISGASATNRALAAKNDAQESLQLALAASGMSVWHISIPDQLLIFDDTLAALYQIPKPSPMPVTELVDHLRSILDNTIYGDYLEYLHNEYDGIKYNDSFECLTVKLPDGSTKYTKNSVKHIFDEDGQIKQVIGMTWDITEDILLLKRLQETTLQAAEASRAKSDFLSRMSHEIRTPLNAIINMTKIAKGTSDLTARNECLSAVSNASTQLLSIVNDVLDISKIESGKMNISEAPFLLGHAIEKISNMFEDSLLQKNLRFESNGCTNLDCWYIGDEMRITQILTNLLSNAVKFTPAGGVISISSRELTYEGTIPQVQLSVKDTGIGMSPEQQVRIFNAFEQADGSTTRRFGGTGLGLSICKNLVERMGGTITLDSKVGIGSEFVVTIPLAHGQKPNTTTEEELVAQEFSTASYDFSNLHILLAEDMEINQEILCILLEGTGVSIDIADNGLIAVDKFMAAPEEYDLILMDLQMPELTGLDATKQIRSFDHPHAKEIPIIALTASAFREDVEECLAAGMNDHLAKPIDIEQVIKKIYNYTKNR